MQGLAAKWPPTLLAAPKDCPLAPCLRIVLRQRRVMVRELQHVKSINH